MTLINNSGLDQNQWGNWVYDHSTLTLQYKVEGDWVYEIDLESRCNTAAEMLDWIFQLHDKRFISDKDIRDLLRAFNDLFGHVQATLCPFGRPRGVRFTNRR